MGNLSFLSAWSNSSPSLVYRPCALAGAARLQRLSEAEPLDGSFVRGAKTWAPRAGRPLTPIGGASAVHEHKQRARAKGA